MGAFLRLLPLILLTTWLCLNRPSQDPKYQLHLCGENLRKIGVELERVRLTEDSVIYPDQLPNTVAGKALPGCPVGGVERYREGYKRSRDGRSYVLVCSGENHLDADVPPDYPRIAFSSLEDSDDGAGRESEQGQQSGEEHSEDQEESVEKTADPEDSADEVSEEDGQASVGLQEKGTPESAPTHSD